MHLSSEEKVNYCYHCHRTVTLGDEDVVMQHGQIYHLECWKEQKNCYEEIEFE